MLRPALALAFVALLAACQPVDKQVAHCRNVADILMAAETPAGAYRIEVLHPAQTANGRKMVFVQRDTPPAGDRVDHVRCEYLNRADVVQAAAIYVVDRKLDLARLASTNASAMERMRK